MRSMYCSRIPALSSAARYSCTGGLHAPASRHSYSACSALVRDIQQDVASKKRSATEVVQEYLEKIHAREERLDSFLTVDDQGALRQVRNTTPALGPLQQGSKRP